MKIFKVKYKGCVILPKSLNSRSLNTQDRTNIFHLCFNRLQSALPITRRLSSISISGDTSRYDLFKGNARNTSDDFRGSSELTIDRKSVKVVQQLTRNILSEHPIKQISFFQPIKEPQYFCYVGKEQTHGSIGEDRACFFFKLDGAEDMTVLKDSFHSYFQRAAVGESGSSQSSGSNTTVSTPRSLDRRPGGNYTTLHRTPSDFGEYLSGRTLNRDARLSLAGIDIGGSVRLSDAGDFAHNVTKDTGIYFSGTDSAFSHFTQDSMRDVGTNPARPPTKNEQKADLKSDSTESEIMKQINHPSFS